MTEMKNTIPCVVCGKQAPQTLVPAARVWCSPECYDAWKIAEDKRLGHDAIDPQSGKP